MPAAPDLYARYLRLLGFDQMPSGLDGLRLLVRRHLFRVPFENVSKLLLFAREGAGRPRTLTEFLDDIEYRDLGGTCHSCNPYLAGLLRHLGYDAHLLGADMTKPNQHTCIRVHLDGVPYHVDVGYGGPFREPMRLDRLPHDFQEGALRYLFDHNRHEDVYEMKVLAGEERRHGYLVHGPPQELAFFHENILGSFAATQTFMRCLRLVRVFEDHSVELVDRKLMVRTGTQEMQTELKTIEELQSTVATQLAMPRCPIANAVEILEQLTGTRLVA
jgi:arylamine N-acetyltransferase